MKSLSSSLVTTGFSLSVAKYKMLWYVMGRFVGISPQMVSVPLDSVTDVCSVFIVSYYAVIDILPG